jgi:hypothetical protein
MISAPLAMIVAQRVPATESSMGLCALVGFIISFLIMTVGFRETVVFFGVLLRAVFDLAITSIELALDLVNR